MDWPNPKNELVNCIHCGRDTRSKASVCPRCGGFRNYGNSREDKDRPCFRIDGESQMDLLSYGIDEDDYGEESGPEINEVSWLEGFEGRIIDDERWQKYDRKNRGGN